MKLSCSAIAWGQVKDVESFRNVLKTIKGIGYEGVGIEYNLLPPELMKDPAQVGSLAKEAGLEVPSMAINENTAYQAEAAEKMGAKSGWLCLFEKDVPGAEAVTKMHLQEFSKRGLRVGIHPHIRSNVETEAQLDRLISAMAPHQIDVCFDSAHQLDLGMDLPSFIKKYSERIELVHLKDLRAMVPPKDVDFDHDFVDLGVGVVDFQGVSQALKDIGFGRWLMVEVDFAHDTTVEESVKHNYEYVKKLF